MGLYTDSSGWTWQIDDVDHELGLKFDSEGRFLADPLHPNIDIYGFPKIQYDEFTLMIRKLQGHGDGQPLAGDQDGDGQFSFYENQQILSRIDRIAQNKRKYQEQVDTFEWYARNPEAFAAYRAKGGNDMWGGFTQAITFMAAFVATAGVAAGALTAGTAAVVTGSTGAIAKGDLIGGVKSIAPVVGEVDLMPEGLKDALPSLPSLPNIPVPDSVKSTLSSVASQVIPKKAPPAKLPSRSAAMAYINGDEQYYEDVELPVEQPKSEAGLGLVATLAAILFLKG